LVEKTAQEIRNKGAIAKAYVVDVSDNLKVYQTAELTKNDFGRVDILINNAGIVSGKKLVDNPDENIKKVIAVNLMAHFWTVKAFLPDMMVRNHGHVVTIASLAGTLGVAGLGDYCASKFGVFGLDESLRAEMRALGKTGVKTTCVCPYYINTGMFDGVKNSLLFPVLDPEYVVTEIVKGVLTNQAEIFLPKLLKIRFFTRLFPSGVADYLNKATGVSRSMDTFKGRH